MSHLMSVDTRISHTVSARWPQLLIRLIVALAASAVVLTLTPFDVAAQAEEESDELIAVQAQIDAIPCPTIAGLEAQPRTADISATVVDGVLFPNSTIGFRCRYDVPGQPGAGVTEISVNIRYVGSGDLFGCDAEPVREQTDRAVTHREIKIEESINATAQYTIPFTVGSALPGIEDLVQASISQLSAVGPLATVCQYEPVLVTCPEISGMTTEGVEVNTGDALIATCNYLPVETEEFQPGQASLSVSWATDRSTEASLRRACSDPGEQFRDQTARIADGTLAAQASWYSNFAGASSTEMNPAAEAVLAQVREQATSCEEVQVEAIFTPVPEYLADVYGDNLANSQAFYSRNQVAPTPVVVETPVPTTQPVESTATTTIVTASPDDDPTEQNDQSVVPAVDTGPPGWQTAVFAVVSVGAIILSLLGVALALFLMRRETRIRPRFDVFRLLITVVVAVTMVLVFSRQAPLWAVGIAIVAGGAIGVVQGRNLDIRAAGSKLYGRRAAWGLIAFAAGIVLVQIAGWLNRTGAISVGIALSFVSAALTAGLIVGRKPQIAQARLSSSAVVTLVLVAGFMIALAPGAPGFTQNSDSDEQADDPAADVPCGGFDQTRERCGVHEMLIDLVDWDVVTFNGGLLAGSDKPPIVIEVERGLDLPPDPISRTIEWNQTVSDQKIAQSVTETFSFELTSEGVCCSILYEGIAQERFRNVEEPIEWAAEGRLSDIQTVGSGLTGAFLSLGEGVRGVPFGEQRQLEWGAGGKDVCGRYVAETVPNMSQNAEFSTLTKDGESVAEDQRTVRTVGLASMSIPCEVEGYTFDAAVEAAPSVPVGTDRLSPCPTRQELIPALADGGFEVTANATIGEMFTVPNEVMCSGGALVAPIMFGNGQKGGVRSEFMFEFAPFEEQTVWGDDSALLGVLGASTIDPDERCLLADDGRPIANPDLERCNYNTAHQVADGGWISISSDLQFDDGPNVTVRASMPWGSYRYRCHHCELDDPEIDRFIGALNNFAGEWPDTLAAEVEEVEGLEDEASPATDGSDTAEPTVDELTEQAEALGIDPDLIDIVLDEQDSDDPDRRAAAVAALVGLMGSLGLAGTALAESGMSPTEVAEAFRSGGIDGINNALDERAQADAAETVIDEYGDELRPGEDGLYEWDDGDSTRRVDRAELAELIGAARGGQAAQATDEVQRLAEHDRLADENWQTLRDRVRIETAVEMSEIELAAHERQELFDRGIRLRDALEHSVDGPLRENMLDFLERNPAPTDEQFADLRDIMRHRDSDQRVIDSLDQRSEVAMAMEGIQSDVARLAELAGQPLLAAAIRNPGVPARMGVAYATGGMSEAALAPIDLWLALDGKADAVMAAENRDLTTPEIVQEVAWAVAVEYIGARLGGAGAPDPPPAPRRPMQLLSENYMSQVKPGQRIPLLHQTGYTPDHLRRLTRFAEENGVIPGTRTANQYSAAHIRAGNALPKPLSVKPKSINDIDLHLGARADHLGTVGFFEPKMPDTSKMSAELRRQVQDRFASRMAEQSKYLDEILANPNLRIEGGRIFDVKTGKAFAGDMDLVYLKDARTGEIITGERYRMLRDKMIDQDLIEHGAEFNIHADLTEGLTKDTDAYNAAFDEASKISGNVLMPTHKEVSTFVMESRDGQFVLAERVLGIPVHAD